MRPSTAVFRRLSVACLLGLALSAGAAVAGGDPARTPRGEEVLMAEVDWTGTIVALDASRRLVTLQVDGGQERTLPVDERETYFDRLAVGDRVHLRYHRSVVFDIQPAQSGEPGAYIAGDEDARVEDGLIGRFHTEVVTVLAPLLAIDTAGNTISVRTPSGGTRVLDVVDPAHRAALPSLKVGDFLRVRFREGYIVDVAHGH